MLDVPAFPGDRFGLGMPEAIGDAAQARWFNRLKPDWKELDNGVWESACQDEGELSYTMTVTPGEDTVDVRISLTNESDREWKQTIAFNCFQSGGPPVISDHECVRHWVGVNGKLTRLIEIPRKCGPRPTIQLYGVGGAPPWQEIPFVANFRASPEDVVLEPWMAIVARDGKRLVAAVSKPAMCLFQNMEYSCIHSSAGFGRLEPGQTGTAITKVYFVEASLEEFYARMRADMG